MDDNGGSFVVVFLFSWHLLIELCSNVEVAIIYRVLYHKSSGFLKLTIQGQEPLNASSPFNILFLFKPDTTGLIAGTPHPPAGIALLMLEPVWFLNINKEFLFFLKQYELTAS